MSIVTVTTVIVIIRIVVVTFESPQQFWLCETTLTSVLLRQQSHFLREGEGKRWNIRGLRISL